MKSRASRSLTPNFLPCASDLMAMSSIWPWVPSKYKLRKDGQKLEVHTRTSNVQFLLNHQRACPNQFPTRICDNQHVVGSLTRNHEIESFDPILLRYLTNVRQVSENIQMAILEVRSIQWPKSVAVWKACLNLRRDQVPRKEEGF
jgi:hypothetical protein